MPIKLYLILKNCDKIAYNTQYFGNCVLWLNEDIYPLFPAEVYTELYFSMHIKLFIQ